MIIENLSEKEKGYLFGMYEGDGYSNYHKKSRHYVVEFFLNSERDKKIIDFVYSLLKKTGLNPFLMKDKRFKCIRIKVNSKKFLEFIENDYECLLKDKDFSIGFVSGFLDAEGGINKAKSFMALVNTNIGLMKIVSKILKDFGIENKLILRKKSIKDKQKQYIIYVPVKFNNLDHISIKAGLLKQ